MAWATGMAMRTCGHCGLRRAQMTVVIGGVQSNRIGRPPLFHTVLQCPDCGRLTIRQHNGPNQHPAQIIDVYPMDEDMALDVKHLPEGVAQYYKDAQGVLNAGYPDAAAVQLRRTLEAAVAHFDVSGSKSHG
jgi:hypothetical protein